MRKNASEMPEFKELIKELREYAKEYDTVTFMGESFSESGGVAVRVVFTNDDEMIADLKRNLEAPTY